MERFEFAFGIYYAWITEKKVFFQGIEWVFKSPPDFFGWEICLQITVFFLFVHAKNVKNLLILIFLFAQLLEIQVQGMIVFLSISKFSDPVVENEFLSPIF